MKRLVPPFILVLLLMFGACKPGGPADEAADMYPDTILFQVVSTRHPVKDFNRFKSFFDANDSIRTANGIQVISLGRGLEDTSMVQIASEIMDMAKVKAFFSSDMLSTLRDSAGVSGPAESHYINVIRSDTSAAPSDIRLSIRHKVADFDAWVKVFNEEGTETRAAHGLVDRALGRGIDDPNMVYMLFAVTDMDKAMARAQSPELEELKTKAGVQGETIAFAYRIVE